MGIDHMGIDHMGIDHMGIDQMRIDKVEIDKVGIDEVGRYLSIKQRAICCCQIPSLASYLWGSPGFCMSPGQGS